MAAKLLSHILQFLGLLSMQLVSSIALSFAPAVRQVTNALKVGNALSPLPNLGSLYSLGLLKLDARRSTKTAGAIALQRGSGLARTSERRRASLALTTVFSVPGPYDANRPRSDGALAFYKNSKVVHSSQFLDATATACRTMYDLSSWGGKEMHMHPSPATLRLLWMNPLKLVDFTCGRRWWTSTAPRLGAASAELSSDKSRPQFHTQRIATRALWKFWTATPVL